MKLIISLELLNLSVYTFSSHDSNGNPHSIAKGGVTYGLSFDYENQLTQVTYSNGTPTSSFLYNGDNLRVRKTDSTGTTVFLYDGSTVIGEAGTTGTMQVYYTPGVDYRRVSPTVAGNIFRENGLGSVVQLMNGSSAADRYEYDAYGVTYTLQQVLANNVKFAGMHGYYTDGDSGMQLLGHRYYLPSLGRFLTQDPLGHEAGLNLYQYADQNPLVNIDPDGLSGVPTSSQWEELLRPKGLFETLGSYVGLGTAGYNIDHIPEAVSYHWRSFAQGLNSAMEHALLSTVGPPGGKGGTSEGQVGSRGTYKHTASPEFWEDYKSLPRQVQRQADRQFKKMLEDPTSSGLNLERLGGYKNRWSARINDQYRAIGQRTKDGFRWT